MAADLPSRNTKNSSSRRTTAKRRRGQHLLDVSVRADEAVRQRKLRLVSLLSKFLLAFGLVIGGYFGVTRAVSALLLKNPDYNVADLTMETDGILQPDTVLKAADLHQGDNIFLLNLSRAKARIEAIPEVEKVQITRQLPNRIAIQINERMPVAWIAPNGGPTTPEEAATSSNVCLIDSRGIMLHSRRGAAQRAYLPLIRSYSGGPLEDGQEAQGDDVHAALDLLHAHQESLITARFQIEEIDLAKHFGLEVKDRNGLRVLFGLDDMDRQLKRLDVYLQTIDQRGQKPQTIDLMMQRNVPVTFVAESAPVDSSPSPPSPVPQATSTPKIVIGNKDKDPHGKSKHDDSKRRP